VDTREITRRLTRRLGAGIAGWCAEVPALASETAERWSLVLGDPLPSGASSVTLRCIRSDGSPAVLKLSPDLPVVSEQVAMLTAFGPSGRVPAVLAANVAAGVVLLELIEPGTRADELTPRPPAEDWASLLQALHAAAVPPDVLPDLRAQCGGFFTRIGRRVCDPEIGGVVGPADVERGWVRCQALLASETTRLLDGGSRGLVAIDPRACVGDPCFDAVDYLLDGAGSDGVDARCGALAVASGLDAGRLFEWCRAIAAIVAIAYLGRAGRESAIPELLTLAR